MNHPFSNINLCSSIKHSFTYPRYLFRIGIVPESENKSIFSSFPPRSPPSHSSRRRYAILIGSRGFRKTIPLYISLQQMVRSNQFFFFAQSFSFKTVGKFYYTCIRQKEDKTISHAGIQIIIMMKNE